MSKKYKIIALYGKSGSGKDYTANRLLQIYPDMIKIVSDTTRPIRDREVEGLDYNFLSLENFNKKEHLEVSTYNEWFYGTPMNVFKKGKIHVGVFDLEGMNNILNDDRLEILPVFILASDKTRMLRCLQREANPNVLEICRRFLADEEEYKTKNSSFSGMIACENVEELVNLKGFKNFL